MTKSNQSTNEIDREAALIRARAAKRHAYNRYSKFAVGAAVITESGEVFSGANIENASYGATMCAERVAIFNAVTRGHTKLKYLALTTSSTEIVPVCGLCLQVISEFAGDLEIYIENFDGTKHNLIKSSDMLKYPLIKEHMFNALLDPQSGDDKKVSGG